MSYANSRTGSDAWVSANSPSRNFSGQTRYQLETPGADTRLAYVYLKNPAPRYATVLSATLYLFGWQASGVTSTVGIHALGAKFTASRVTYNTRPATVGAGVYVQGTQNTDGQQWAFDVTAIVQSWCDGATNYGLRVESSATSVQRFYALAASNFRPYLEVEWSDAPDAPDQLSPSGGSAVSIPNPILSFHYFDVSGAERMQSCQVQINGSNSWSAPTWDSGEQSTSDPELDLSVIVSTVSGNTYGGLAVGGTAWWRARVRNESGVWSDWSDATTFTRTARGTLTITSPTAGTIADSTQEVIWNLAGATQTGWRITIWDDADPSTVLYDTGHRSGTDNSFTLPVGVITSESILYRMRVRVWDILNRAHTPNDKSFTEVVTTFQFNEDASIPVTQLVAFADPKGLPHVILTWQRSDAPDEFVIERGGVFIDTVDPADVILPDGSYLYTDKTATPNNQHTYKVRSRVNGKLSGGATAVVQYTLSDVWLVDPDQALTHLVPVAVNLTDCTFTMPEVSGSYQPVDGDTPVVFVQGQQGLAGTIVGRIVGIPATGITSEAAVADMLWMKARPDNDLRMTLGAQNLRVRINNVTLGPLATRDINARTVSFDFHSLDGPSQ